MYLKLLKDQYKDKIAIIDKRPKIKQILLPFYHEDGDLVEVYIDEKNSKPEKVRICDFGKTLMRLSYTYELNSEYRESIFNDIIKENDLCVDSGNIYLDVKPTQIYGAILQFIQGVSKVSCMQFFSREYAKSMFYELLDEFITSKLSSFKFEKKYFPIKDRDEFEVDYVFHTKNKPIFLFGVNDKSKARLVGWMCSEFLRHPIEFRSVIVHEDFDDLPKLDRKRITNIVDKQFTNQETFQENSIDYLRREAS